MEPVSDDDVRKRLLEKPSFKLAAKGVFRLGRCYIFWQGVPGLRASNWESTAIPTIARLTGGTSMNCQNQNQKWFNKDATYVHQHNNSHTE